MTHTPWRETALREKIKFDAKRRLEAAAPALLEVSEKAEALILKQQIDGTTFEECAEFLDEVRAAIAQAKGEK